MAASIRIVKFFSDALYLNGLAISSPATTPTALEIKPKNGRCISSQSGDSGADKLLKSGARAAGIISESPESAKI